MMQVVMTEQPKGLKKYTTVHYNYHYQVLYCSVFQFAASVLGLAAEANFFSLMAANRVVYAHFWTNLLGREHIINNS